MATKGYWKSGAVDSPPDTSTLTSKGYPTSGDPKTAPRRRSRGRPGTTCRIK